jgi:hypothetical protein
MSLQKPADSNEHGKDKTHQTLASIQAQVRALNKVHDANLPSSDSPPPIDRTNKPAKFAVTQPLKHQTLVDRKISPTTNNNVHNEMKPTQPTNNNHATEPPRKKTLLQKVSRAIDALWKAANLDGIEEQRRVRENPIAFINGTCRPRAPKGQGKGQGR